MKNPFEQAQEEIRPAEEQAEERIETPKKEGEIIDIRTGRPVVETEEHDHAHEERDEGRRSLFDRLFRRGEVHDHAHGHEHSSEDEAAEEEIIRALKSSNPVEVFAGLKEKGLLAEEDMEKWRNDPHIRHEIEETLVSYFDMDSFCPTLFNDMGRKMEAYAKLGFLKEGAMQENFKELTKEAKAFALARFQWSNTYSADGHAEERARQELGDFLTEWGILTREELDEIAAKAEKRREKMR